MITSDPNELATSSGSEFEARAEITNGIVVYLGTFITLTTIAWAVVSFYGLVLRAHYPKNWLFVHPMFRYWDFTVLTQRLVHFGEPTMLSRTDLLVTYPYPIPSMYPVLLFMWLFGSGALYAFELFSVFAVALTGGWFAFTIYRVARHLLPIVAVGLTILLGFPQQFMIDRGNIEVFAWLLVIGGVIAFAYNRDYSAATLWSIAAAIKLAPAIVFLLLLVRRKYAAFALAVGLTAALTIGAWAGVGPTIRQAATDSSRSTDLQVHRYILVRDLTQYDESLFAITKQVNHLFLEHVVHRHSAAEELQTNEIVLRWYNRIVPLAGLLLFALRLRKLPCLNNLICATVLYILLPQVSYEYRLIFLYIAWGAFLYFLLTDVATGGVRTPNSTIHTHFVCFAVTFSPLSWVRLGDFYFGGQLKALVLIVILAVALRVPMPSSLFGEIDRRLSDGTASS